MTTYDTYKPTGIDWLGEIPAGWRAVALKYVVETKITDGPHETPEFVEEGVPFVSAEAVKEGRINFNYRRGNIKPDVDALYAKKCKPKRGDIFIVKSGSTTGKIALVDFDDDFNIWSPLALVRVKPEHSSAFIFYALSSEYFQKNIQLSWSFGTQPNIGMNVLENLRVVLPGEGEQTAIAAYLDDKTAKIDTLIDRKRRLIDLLREEKATLINEAVTKGINPDVPMKPSGIEWLGDIPAHWNLKKLRYVVLKVGSGVTPSGGASVYKTEGIPLLRSQNIHFDGLRLDDVAYITEEVDESMRNSRVQAGDVLINITGASIGRCYFIPDGFGPGKEAAR
ncbi:hypothetical protein GCM10023187_27340 [Nibrella viscosa]|uniref:Type I restriction modification DNA specificity domain-containing protein n=1 Tax=Nibrella viscosa TaxID=1084524 RepID=A0ABP8KH77_9BACT